MFRKKDINLLLSGIKHGNENDFREYFNIKFPKLVHYATRFINQERAEDIVQDVFVWIWINREEIEFGSSFNSFLYQSVYNKIINLVKRDKMIQSKHYEIKTTKKTLDYFADEELSDKILKETRLELIQEAIERLPEQPKICIKMSYIQGMKSSEIAEKLNLSPRTVETHLYNGLKTLRRSLNIIFQFFIF